MQINPETVTQTLTLFVGNLPTFIAVDLAHSAFSALKAV
jgi:hypothetical protein